MPNLIDELQRDHANFGKVLSILSQQADLLSQDRDPDYVLMLDIADYFDNYADLIHHPIEDMVFEFYRARYDHLGDEIEALSRQHKDLKALTQSLYQALDDINKQVVTPKDRLEQLLGRYLDGQGAHMRAEETRVYPALRQRLTATDFSELEPLLPARVDPLFGPAIREEYDQLYQRILARTD